MCNNRHRRLKILCLMTFNIIDSKQYVTLLSSISFFHFVYINYFYEIILPYDHITLFERPKVSYLAQHFQFCIYTRGGILSASWASCHGTQFYSFKVVLDLVVKLLLYVIPCLFLMK